MKAIIEMAKEAGFQIDGDSWIHAGVVLIDGRKAIDKQLERFAELVTEQANARANTSWTLMCKKMVEAEREACAKVCEMVDENDLYFGSQYAAAIRARSNT